jgi:hypothetical protein
MPKWISNGLFNELMEYRHSAFISILLNRVMLGIVRHPPQLAGFPTSHISQMYMYTPVQSETKSCASFFFNKHCWYFVTIVFYRGLAITRVSDRCRHRPTLPLVGNAIRMTRHPMYLDKSLSFFS